MVEIIFIVSLAVLQIITSAQQVKHNENYFSTYIFLILNNLLKITLYKPNKPTSYRHEMTDGQPLSKSSQPFGKVVQIIIPLIFGTVK